MLIATLVPLYVATQAAQVNEGMTTGLTSPGLEVTGALGTGKFPLVGTLNDDTRFDGPQLAVGDQLLEVEGRSLKGVSGDGFWALATPAVRRSGGARISAARGERRLATTLLGEPSPHWWSGVPAAVAGVLVALIILLRAPGWPPARRFFIGMAALGVWRSVATILTVLAPGELGVHVSQSLFLVSFPIALGEFVSVFWDFTASARPLRAWMRAQPWLVGVGLFALTFAYQWLPIPIHTTWLIWVGLAQLAFVSMLVGVTRCYLRADSLERRQLRWVLYGCYIQVVAIGAVIMTHLGGYSPALLALTNAAGLAIPVGILIAVLGYRFLDIDRLISATTSLTILGVLLHEVILHVIPDVAEATSSVVGVSATTGKWALSLAFAAVVVRAHGRLRPWIDQRLFAQRISVEEGLAQLVVDLAGCRSARELTELSTERVAELLRPESLVVYARAESAFTPLFARGRAVPPALASNSPLIHVLESRTTPLSASAKEIDPFDRAVLATLAAEVLIPTRRRETLDAFICLGRKRSGDIYTPAELALLGAVASASSEVLKGLGDAEVLEQARAMQASLRRYVPGVIAEQLESGRDLQAGEREVTVLFVDLRGFASGAERRPVEDVFSTVNQHSERVSRIVQAHGGAVIELNGDGMTAIFGAPLALAAKEREAVEAAREIVDSSPPGLAVGLGIATGLAYAGGIRAADRVIWSVFGETPNLAARLQALTRDLDASIAADEPTRRGAGYVCADFTLHHAVSVPGRSERIDVFALPLARAVAA